MAIKLVDPSRSVTLAGGAALRFGEHVTGQWIAQRGDIRAAHNADKIESATLQAPCRRFDVTCTSSIAGD